MHGEEQALALRNQDVIPLTHRNARRFFQLPAEDDTPLPYYPQRAPIFRTRDDVEGIVNIGMLLFPRLTAIG